MNLAIPKEGQSLCLKVRKELGERAQILKEQWLSEKKALPSKYDYRRKKHVKPDPKWGFLHRCAEEPDFFIPLMTFKNKYYVNLTFKCFLFYLFIKHFLIVALCQKKFIPVNF